MRIAILIAANEWGGLESHAIALAEALKGRGHSVMIVGLGSTSYDQYVDRLAGYDFIHAGQRNFLDGVGFVESLKLFRGLACDVAIFEKGEVDSASWMFDLAARLCCRRFISIEQLISPRMPPRLSRRYLAGLIPGLGLWWYRVSFMRYSRSLCPHSIVCVSDAVRLRLVDDYGFPGRKTLTIHNGIDPSRFLFSSLHRTMARRAWGASENDLVFGAVGRLAPVKGYDLAIKGFQQLCAKFPERKSWLILVGDGPAKPALQQLANTMGLSNAVLFPGSTNRPWEVYPGFDVFVMPSQAEGMPHALLEAMAAQCPPIGNDVGGVGEVIDDPSIGWLVKQPTETQFADAMQEAMGAGSANLVQMGQRARQRVISQFDSATLTSRIIDLIEGRPKGLSQLQPDIQRTRSEQAGANQ